MKPEGLDRALLKIIYLDAAAIAVAQTLGLDGLVSGLFTLTFPLTVVLWLRTVRERMRLPELLTLVTLGLAAVSVLLDAWISGAEVRPAYFRKWIIFCMTLLFFGAAYRLEGSAEVTRWVKRLGDLLAVWLPGAYILGGDAMFRIGGRVSGYLTFGFTNPNLAAMVLACLYMLQIMGIFESKGWKKGVRLALAGILAYFLWLTRSRNCMLAMAVFTFCACMLPLAGERKLRMPGWMAALVSILPALFVAGYLLIVSMGRVPDWLRLFVGDGKGLDSRMAVWGPALEALGESPLIGAYCRISGGLGSSQMHNSHLDIAASYGVPVLVPVCVLLGMYLHQGGREYRSRSHFCNMLAFACGLLMGLGEAAVFSGGLGIYIFVGMFLHLANEEEAV